jgi:predicted transcriptional regulator
MPIDIPDELRRRLEQLAKGTGQEVSALVCEAIEQRLAREEGQKRAQEAAAWQPFSDQDPFVSLIGSGEDDAADVSRKKYDYLADGSCRGNVRLMT